MDPIWAPVWVAVWAGAREGLKNDEIGRRSSETTWPILIMFYQKTPSVLNRNRFGYFCIDPFQVDQMTNRSKRPKHVDHIDKPVLRNYRTDLAYLPAKIRLKALARKHMTV